MYAQLELGLKFLGAEQKMTAKNVTTGKPLGDGCDLRTAVRVTWVGVNFFQVRSQYSVPH